MIFLKKYFNKLKNFFYIPQAPIGLKAMGIQSRYLNKINRFNYSVNRFYTDLLSPVQDPYLLNLSDL